MNLDEAIKHCKEVAHEKRIESGECIGVNDFENAEACHECGEYYKQLSEWLAELKQCRESRKQELEIDRWISCIESMPESRKSIIFTVDRGHPFVCAGYRINNERKGLKRWFDKLSGLNFSDYDVKAWMPMPDAYEPPNNMIGD